jgi:predicted unusual protein kinase regulating ubiquinone biosynthesis (AarF/ABC1/UbiB family)
MCTGLDPEFNIWSHLAPYAQKLVASEMGAGDKPWLKEIGILLQKILLLPGRVITLVERMEKGDLRVRDVQLEDQVHRLERSIQRLTGVILFAVLIFGGIQLYLGGQLWFGGILAAIGGLLLLFFILRR